MTQALDTVRNRMSCHSRVQKPANNSSELWQCQGKTCRWSEVCFSDSSLAPSSREETCTREQVHNIKLPGNTQRIINITILPGPCADQDLKSGSESVHFPLITASGSLSMDWQSVTFLMLKIPNTKYKEEDGPSIKDNWSVSENKN